MNVKQALDKLNLDLELHPGPSHQDVLGDKARIVLWWLSQLPVNILDADAWFKKGEKIVIYMRNDNSAGGRPLLLEKH